MLSENRFEFTKEDIGLFLKELAKEYRRLVGKSMPAELILIGGASVLINYGFRDMTTDIDALIQASSGMKEAVNRVGDRFGLPNGWLNADFTTTASYSPKLIEHSVYYKTFSNVLTIRTVSAEYLIAMKLRSGRQYKSDLSDILGILAEHEKRGASISLSMIRKAVVNLYDDWEAIPVISREYIQNVMESGRFSELYEKVADSEKETRIGLSQFEKDYPGVLKESNLDTVTKSIQRTGNRESVLRTLREMANREPENQRERPLSESTDHDREEPY